jgi:serine/threonine protein kinase/Rieske Fe-S protein
MQTMIVDQLVGQIVGKQGQYRVERLLGQSRLNAVYLARNLSDQNMVALTLYITPEQFPPDAYQRFIQRFSAAIPALVGLQHAHILPVYESGEQSGYPYFITPYLTNGSLADQLRQQQRFSYEDVLAWLEQIVPAIQFAHNRGLIHGTLKPANLVLDSNNQVLVAGFGLMHVLQLSGIMQSRLPYAHLLSLAETFLVAPEYLAPEVVEGRAIDKRSDIYALGCILFELLSGTPPFKGNDPLAVAQMHVQQPQPSLHLLVPELPLALVSVVHQALERNPQRRFQQVSDVLEAFTQVVSGVTNPRMSSLSTRNLGDTAYTPEMQDTPAALAVPTNWQLKPPIVTGKIPSIPNNQPVAIPSVTNRPLTTGPVAAWQFSPPISTGRLEAVSMNTPTSPQIEPVAPPRMPSPPVQPVAPPRMPSPPVQPVAPPRMPYVPPFEQGLRQPASEGAYFQSPQQDQSRANVSEENAWWVQTQEPDYITQEKRSSKRSSPKKNSSRSAGSKHTRSAQKSGPSRRQVLALAATGGVIAAGALFASHLPNLHLGLSAQQANAGTMTTSPQTQQKIIKQAPATPQAQTHKPVPQATQQMTHKGTAIGSTSLLKNSDRPFLNPADGKSSLLIHLPNGNFVAYKQACTHEGVPVNYDPGTHNLICPAHGAIFDPANKGAVLQGPAMTALPMISISVNTDGTITTL